VPVYWLSFMEAELGGAVFVPPGWEPAGRIEVAAVAAPSAGLAAVADFL
jgi:hypothetical protein